MMTLNWRIEWTEGGVSTLDEGLVGRWDKFFNEEGNIWQSRQFAICWEQTVAAAREWQPYSVYATDSMGHAVLYFLYAREGTVSGLQRTILEPVGAESFDYQDPLSIGMQMEAADWDSFWSALGESLKLKFPKLGSLLIYRLTTPFSGTIAVAHGKNAIAPILSFGNAQTLSDVISECGSSHRANIRRDLRVAEKMGTVSMDVLSGAEVEEALDAMFVTYEQQWGAGGASHIFQKPEIRTFFKSLSGVAQAQGKLHFSRLKVGDDIWHWHYGFMHRGSLLWYKPTYNPDFSKYSPGKVHLALLIEHCLENGGVEIDFGYGAEPYKFLWTKSGKTLHTYRVIGNDKMLAAARAAGYYRHRFQNAVTQARTKIAGYLRPINTR